MHVSIWRATSVAVVILGGCFGGACEERNDDTPDYLTAECALCATDDTQCLDGLDNDLDGLTDCTDPDCAVAWICFATGPEDNASFCDDGLDNDLNGYTDCLDFGCVDTSACKADVQTDEDTLGPCTDGVDNDWNGFIDCGDRSCGESEEVPVCEGSDAKCSDGLDNDGNGFTDCQDYGCSKPSWIKVCD